MERAIKSRKGKIWIIIVSLLLEKYNLSFVLIKYGFTNLELKHNITRHMFVLLNASFGIIITLYPIARAAGTFYQSAKDNAFVNVSNAKE